MDLFSERMTQVASTGFLRRTKLGGGGTTCTLSFPGYYRSCAPLAWFGQSVHARWYHPLGVWTA